jgi:hypothetical protein
MKLKHFFNKNLIYAFIPFSVFQAQHLNKIEDLTTIKIAVTKDCNSLSKHSTGIFNVSVAKTESSRIKGLGGRKNKLGKNEGMLFVFDYPQKLTFWMKDTYIPLQIAYFNSDGKMLSFHEMPVEKNPNKPKKLYPSKESAIAALEVAPKTFSNQILKANAVLCVDEESIPKKTIEPPKPTVVR